MERYIVNDVLTLGWMKGAWVIKGHAKALERKSLYHNGKVKICW